MRTRSSFRLPSGNDTGLDSEEFAIKKKSLKGLHLHRETLRTLEDREVAPAHGNFASAYRTCDVPCQTNEASVCYNTCNTRPL